MSNKMTLLLVGQHYVPPAKALLEHLPAGAPLRLRLDTENPYDEYAVEACVEGSSVPESQHLELSVKLPGMGFALEEIIAPGAWWKLGHVGASDGKPLTKARMVRADLQGNKDFLEALAAGGGEYSAKLGFDGSGLIVIEVETP